MAKMQRKPSIVYGLSVQDILNLDMDTFNKLGLSDMRKVVGRLVSAGNKRLRNFERVSDISPAVRHVQRSGGAFSTRGKNLNSLRAEYIRAKNFLQARTGTRKGWQKVKRDTVKALKRQGIGVTAEQLDKMWKAYEELKELDPEVSTKRLKYSVLTDISDMLDDGRVNPEEIALSLHSRLSELYEQRAGLENDDDGVSSFFE